MEGAVDDIIKLNAHLGMPPNLHIHMPPNLQYIYVSSVCVFSICGLLPVSRRGDDAAASKACQQQVKHVSMWTTTGFEALR